MKTAPKKTMPETPSRRVTRSQVRMRTGGDEQATILEVTTSVSGRKRGRPPRKPVIKTTEESDTGRVAGRCDGRDESGPAASEVTRRLPSGKDESRAATSEMTKKTRNSNSQQSAIKSHLWVSDSCRKLYRDDVFSVWPVVDLYYICLFWKRYIFASCPLHCVSRRKMFCCFSCLALILVKVSGMLLLIDVFSML